MHNIVIFLSTVILSSMGPLATDIYIPSMPAMTEYFGTSNTLVQWTVSAYMLSFCFTPLIVGPLSDHIGRKRPILIGILISIIATVLCFLSHHIYFLIFARFLQGIGLGIVVSVGRAILPDHFQGKELTKYYSFMTMLIPVILGISPLIGAFIQEQSSWKGVFAFMASYLIVIGILTSYFLKEKKQSSQNGQNQIAARKFELKTLFHAYKHLFDNKSFLTFCFCSVFVFAGITVYLTVASFIFEERLGLSPTECSMSFIVILTYVFAIGFLNSKLISIFKSKKLLYFINPLILLSGISLILFELNNTLNVYTFIFSLLLFYSSIPVTFSNATGLAMASLKGNFGAALALLSFLQFLGGALCSALVSLTDSKSVIPLGITFLLVGLGCLSMLLLDGKISKKSQDIGTARESTAS